MAKSLFINTGAKDMIQRAERSAELAETGSHTGVDAIIFSAIAAEAFPNDLFVFASLFRENELAVDERVVAAVQILKQAESDKVQIKLKYQLLHYALTGKPIDTGSNPYQDFSFLIDLRNSLVHHKVDIVDLSGRAFERHIEKIHGALAVRRLLVRSQKDMPHDWKVAIDESPLAARWAIQTTQNIIRNIIDVIPEKRLKQLFERSSIFKQTQH